MINCGNKEMADLQRAPAAFVKDQGSSSNTHMAAHSISNSSFRESNVLTGFLGHQAYVYYTHIKHTANTRDKEPVSLI